MLLPASQNLAEPGQRDTAVLLPPTDVSKVPSFDILEGLPDDVLHPDFFDKAQQVQMQQAVAVDDMPSSRRKRSKPSSESAAAAAEDMIDEQQQQALTTANTGAELAEGADSDGQASVYSANFAGNTGV